MKIKVEYQSGESIFIPGAVVDYMHAVVEDVDMYAEADYYGDDDTTTYDELKAAILEQAKEYGIAPDTLAFYYDEE